MQFTVCEGIYNLNFVNIFFLTFFSLDVDEEFQIFIFDVRDCNWYRASFSVAECVNNLAV